MQFSSLAVSFGILLALFLSSLAVAKPCRGRANRYMAGFILSVAVSMSYQVLFPTGLYRALPHLTKIYIPTQYLLGPLLFLYISALTVPSFRFKPVLALHFAPCVASVAYLMPFFLESASSKIAFVERRGTTALPTSTEEWVVWLSVQASLWGYTLASLGKYRRYRRSLKDTVSNLSPYAWNWLLFFLMSVLAVLCLFLGVDVLMLGGIPLVAFNPIISVSMTATIVFLSWKAILGLDQIFPCTPVSTNAPEPCVPAVIEQPAPTSPVAEAEDVREGKDLFDVVRAAVQKNGWFRSPELTLPELAERLGYTRTELSRIINLGGGVNFYDFVNKLRVEEVQSRLRADSQGRLSVLQVAFDAGFNTKSTFHTSFKKWTGMTPSIYRRQGPARAEQDCTRADSQTRPPAG